MQLEKLTLSHDLRHRHQQHQHYQHRQQHQCQWLHLLVALFFIAGSLWVLTQPATAQSSPPAYLAQWGSNGSGNGQFNGPHGIAVDSNGNSYVVDITNRRIQKIDSSGAYLTQWGSAGSGDGQFNSHYHIAVDSSGNVYVADGQNHRIQKFSSSGAYLAQWGSNGSGNGQFYIPVGVAVDSSGNVYVADSNNHRVQKFSSSGAYLTKWGSAGSGNGQFYYPQAVAVDSSGNVYVVDNANHRIQKFTSSGTYLTQWGSQGSGNGQFGSYPQGIAVDSSSNVYVVDNANHRIQKFSSSGTYLTQWGSNGSGNGQFSGPYDIAVDSSDNIYVSDTGNHRVQKFGVLPPTPTATPTATALPLPNLRIPSTTQTITTGALSVPLLLTSNGRSIASVAFGLAYDTSCLSFDATTDANSDGLPDAISELPTGFAASLNYNTANQTLEVALYDDTQPITTLNDGTLLTIQFTVKAACIPSDGSNRTVTIGFTANPAPSFGDPTGADVTGTATGATIPLRFNAAPTALALSNSSVAENSAAGTTVGAFSTTDIDSGDSHTYTLVSDAGDSDNASFTLDGNTLQTAAVFDFETKSSYTIRVRTTDSGGLFFEQSFIISVTDMDEAPTAVDDLVDPRTTVFLGGQSGTIDVLANDVANGGVLRVASVTQPLNNGGSVTNNTTNVSYTAPNSSGTSTFTYQATNGSATSNSANVTVNYVASHARGDCNGNGGVSAADFIGVVLEIFDTNNTLYQSKPAWWLTHTGDFGGSPLGCDANNSRNGIDNSSASITAADIICSVLIFFGHPCGVNVQAASAMQAAHLAVADQQATVGATTTLTVTLDTGGNAIAAATFALGLDPAVLHFATTDADEDGVPDAITLNTPAGMSKSVTWNAARKRLEVALFGTGLPLPTLSDGALATVTIAVASDTTTTSTPLALDLVSFSDADGNDLPATDQDGTLIITGNTAATKGLFLPLAVR